MIYIHTTCKSNMSNLSGLSLLCLWLTVSHALGNSLSAWMCNTAKVSVCHSDKRGKLILSFFSHTSRAKWPHSVRWLFPPLHFSTYASVCGGILQICHSTYVKHVPYAHLDVLWSASVLSVFAVDGPWDSDKAVGQDCSEHKGLHWYILHRYKLPWDIVFQLFPRRQSTIVTLCCCSCTVHNMYVR